MGTVTGAPEGLFRGTVTVRGIESPYIEGGETGAAEAVVFVHGNPGSSEDWTELIAAVAPLRRALAVDMPGFGRAGKPRDFPYSVEGYAQHLGATLDQLGVEVTHLVMHDFGGAWGLAWAAAHPLRVMSLTLMNTGLLPGYRWHALARVWRTPLLGELFCATTTEVGFRLLLRRGNPRGLPVTFIRRMYRDFDWGTRRAILALYRATDDPGHLAAVTGGMFQRARFPTLVIWGEADPYIPARYATLQAQYFPGARIVTLPASGHWPFIDDPQRVATELVSFLRQQSSN